MRPGGLVTVRAPTPLWARSDAEHDAIVNADIRNGSSFSFENRIVGDVWPKQVGMVMATNRKGEVLVLIGLCMGWTYRSELKKVKR